MANIYTYRIEDGRFYDPPFPCAVFIVTDPQGRELSNPWESGVKARAFCKHKNNQLKGVIN